MLTTKFKIYAKRVAFLNLLFQSGIIVTGAIVRLTGSGLGCPTWPDCAPGSLVPIAEQAQGYRKFIEFGNRTLTFLVLAGAVALFVVAVKNKVRKIIYWSSIPIVGTFAQAILGGITVLTGLNPVTVMAHFLLSLLLVAVSVKIYDYFKYSEDTRNDLSTMTNRFILLILLVGFLVVLMGTITTGSGPHAGDEAAARFGLDIRNVAWLHADLVFLFIGLIVGLNILTYYASELEPLRKDAKNLLIICLGQGFIGYVQWFAGLPWLLVALHVIGAVITWIFLIKLALKTNYSLLQSFK